ncbi:DUF192 domain-containing protein [Sphingorhabdus arenilitoris]|uniref:DUF192 domain-containing protein n=1 Tax=Sphingorhabdus arenilitoris TaxID=1490041 RepID=A0ABV8RGY9_9SPHN
MRLLLLPALTLAISACNMQGSATAGNTADAKSSCTAGTSLGQSEAGLELRQLCVISHGKTHSFKTEVAATPRQQAQGMMFRQSMADDEGMIFPFPQPRPASFWMKNTVIPLDIIFIGTDGKIESIGANAVPYSLETVNSQGAVQAVLEVRGGLAAKLGIKAGDTVSWAPTQ